MKYQAESVLFYHPIKFFISLGKTEDENLEKRNFKEAGKILGKIWSKTVIDNHPTVAEYIDPPAVAVQSGVETVEDEGGVEEKENTGEGDAEWRATHVR